MYSCSSPFLECTCKYPNSVNSVVLGQLTREWKSLIYRFAWYNSPRWAILAQVQITLSAFRTVVFDFMGNETEEQCRLKKLKSRNKANIIKNYSS